MLGKRELTFEELQMLSSDELHYECRDEVEVLSDDIIGQEKALEALDFGLEIADASYNIYLAGDTILNKARFVEDYVKDRVKDHEAPKDWCYVYNFEDPSMPIPISLETGKGKEFKDDMEGLITNFGNELRRQFDSIEFQLQKTKITNHFKDKNENLMKQIKLDAEEFDFETQITDKDIYFIPIIEGDKMSEEMFDGLSQEEQDIIIENSEILQQRATKVLKAIRENQLRADEKVSKLQTDIGLILIRDEILKLLDKYREYEEISKYIELLEKDIVANMSLWLSEDTEEDGLLSLLPSLYKSSDSDFKKKYEVNLIIDNSGKKGKPVIYGMNPSFYNLIGKIEQESELGSTKSDFTKIKPGLLHKANGGVLILELEELLAHAYSWYIMKLCMKTGLIHYKELKDSTTLPTETLKPIPIPLDVKVVLIGKSEYYQLLKQLEPIFGELFKMKIYFPYEALKNDSNKNKLIAFAKKFVKSRDIEDINKEAMLCLLKYSTRYVMEGDKFLSNLVPIKELLLECCQWAKLSKEKVLTKELMLKTIYEKEKRANYVEERLDDLIEHNQLLIDVKGTKVGQINGLAVLDLGDYTFAKPSRITATTFKGKAGIINIEKEANMSGKVHDKGVHVLTGYLGNKYAKKSPLSLTCQICFEQSYSYVDGDSASSAELYAIISSISEIPIDQSIAVTGSINQFGEIQPIGGVTYKVEGYYSVCKKKGLTGTQGVIIPYQNIKDLVLKEEILEAIKKDEFHIYPVGHVDEAIEILMATPADKVHTSIIKKMKTDNSKKK